MSTQHYVNEIHAGNAYTVTVGTEENDPHGRNVVWHRTIRRHADEEWTATQNRQIREAYAEAKAQARKLSR